MKKIFLLLVALLSLTSYSQSQVTFRYTQKKVFDELIHQYGEPINETGYFEFHFDELDMLQEIHSHFKNNTLCKEFNVSDRVYADLNNVTYGSFKTISLEGKLTYITILIDLNDSNKRNVVIWDNTLNRDVIYNCSVMELDNPSDSYQLDVTWWTDLNIYELSNIRK